MSLFSTAFIVVGSVCFALGFIHLLIFILRRDLKADLFFSLLALAIAAASFFELWTFRADTLSTHIPLLKETLFVHCILWSSFAWFIHYYTKSTKRWPPLIITILYSTALVLNLLSPGSILFSEVVELIPFQLGSDEIIYYANGPSNPYRIIGDIAWVLLLAYALFASIQYGRRSGFGRAALFGGTIFLCLGLGYLHGTLIDLGVADPPYLGSFLFLPLSLVMSYSLAAEVVTASRLSREIKIAESRWRHLLEHVHLAVVGIDRKHDIFYANPFFLEITGYGEADVVKQPFANIVSEEERSEINPRLSDVLAKRSAIVPERALTIVTRSEENRTILWSSVLLENGDTGGNVILAIGKDITDQLQAEIDRDQAIKELEALKISLEEENISLKEIIQSVHGFKEIVGESNELLYVLNKIQQVSQTDSNVLILGETGTGKELVARAIHREGKRRLKPFIRVNCAAIPADLVESELFGHEAGAFTHAVNLRKGKFELADGGVILLDEISEMPLETQAKLLNVLQERELERVGGSQSIPIDVHVIAATNRDLKTEIDRGRFRADLYFRLNVYPITVPPLRNRKEDIPLLVKHFVAVFTKKFGKKIESVPPATLDRIQQYNWPGNVRELQNVIERAIITSESEVLHLADELNQGQPGGGDDQIAEGTLLPLIEMERRHILQALQKTNWQISGPEGAAHMLQMNPSTLRSRIKKHRLEKP